MKNALAIYIHWPFCAHKCPYCDFNSHVREGVDQTRWKAALLKDLSTYDYLAGSHTVTSIFFGGGTPSLMPPDTVTALIDAITKRWQVAPDVEITLEANPTSVEAEKLKVFKAAGVNRVSLGVQALNDKDLAFLGRKHSAAEALKALGIAQDLFDRMTFDLIYARPGQSADDWNAELKQALTFAKGHLSLYQLTIEENTQFFTMLENKRFAMPEESLSAELYALTNDIMDAAGMPYYEVSNYATPGQESRHNLSYWRGDDYIGIGAGAHGRVPDIKTGQRVATQTIKLPEKWLASMEETTNAFAVYEPLDEQTILDERVLMNLRIREGIEFARFRQQTGRDLLPLLNAKALRAFVKKGFLVETPERLCVTGKGMLVLNHITHELLT